ncbi:TPA: hypothetical protein DEG21_05815 [Patescibacteria group bacterium]|nr:hypothetical protein [Candidatus Gracilibacteria bacterium]
MLIGLNKEFLSKKISNLTFHDISFNILVAFEKSSSGLYLFFLLFFKVLIMSSRITDSHHVSF